MAERSRDRSPSAESQPKFPDCSHFRRRNENHRRCQQCRLNAGLPLCTQDSPCLVCKDWLPEAWKAHAQGYSAEESPQGRCRGRKLRWWTTEWNYTHQGTLLLPSVPSLRSHLRPSGLKQSRVHHNPSPWLPASRRRNSSAPRGRTTAGRGRLSADKDTANLPRHHSSRRDGHSSDRRESERARPSSSGGSSSRRRAESSSVSKVSDTRPSSSSSRHH